MVNGVCECLLFEFILTPCGYPVAKILFLELKSFCTWIGHCIIMVVHDNGATNREHQLQDRAIQIGTKYHIFYPIHLKRSVVGVLLDS